ncbi:DUF167 family protein [Bosea sp. (in: a-proteobacteria)]|uniref:DUF167 family protein n=1 Tax=Bosea sp. (in: a-proteobacteria) TaxID=1871050 RepID=UPI002FC9510E
MAAWAVTPDGLQLFVRLTPRGGRDGLDGIETLADGRQVLKARVRAAPSEGEANAALIALLARTLGAPRSAVTLKSGAGARLKCLVVRGDGPALLASLQAHLPGA